MKYIVSSIKNFILSESSEKNGTYRFVLPSYPSDLLLELGRDLQEAFSRQVHRTLEFRYEIAHQLGLRWHEKGQGRDYDNFMAISEHGWYNEDDNLTSLRNELRQPGVDCLVVLLAGYDDINDRGSLLDFFHLDQQAVWEQYLNKSFKKWVCAKLEPVLDLTDNETAIKKIVDLFNTLYAYGMADLLGVSRFLEDVDVSDATEGDLVYGTILNQLSGFKLPNMYGLTQRGARKKISGYVTPAVEFLNYSKFLKRDARNKALVNIEKYQQDPEKDPPEGQEYLGHFNDLEQLLDTLQDYIKNRSLKAREQLKAADFIFIHDEVLNYRTRTKNGNNSTKQLKKIRGLPVQAFLHSIWVTLGDFKKSMTRFTVLSESLTSITLQSTVFKHNFDAGGDNNDIEDANAFARDFLVKVLGGIDALLENHLSPCDKDNSTKLVAIVSKLCPREDNTLKYIKAGSAEPYLEFIVTISGQNGALKRHFRWMLPETHQSRLLIDLLNLTYENYESGASRYVLPVFTVPYLAQIFKARDEGEVNRLLGESLKKISKKGEFMQDMLNVPGFDARDPLNNALINLSGHYQEFIMRFNEHGFFDALEKRCHLLSEAYQSACTKFIAQGGSNSSVLGPFLLKAFMLVANDDSLENWVWKSYLPAAIVTPLHPALLDMLRYQHTYLCDSFRHYLEKLLDGSMEKILVPGRWDDVVDLAKVQYPVLGILVDDNLKLNTNVVGYEYFHLLGDVSDHESLVASKVLLRYSDDEDEEITDADLFRETRASLLIKEVLGNYQKMYAYASDGICIGAYCGQEIQPVIAGIDAYLNEILPQRGEGLYALQLTVFSDVRDESALMQWINAWKDRWQAAELVSSKRHYENCRISIAYRVVSLANRADQFKRVLDDTDLDIMFFTDFIKSGGSKFRPLPDYTCSSEDYSKFPVLEKTCCRMDYGGGASYRERVLSNRRFKLGSCHAEVMNCLKSSSVDPQQKHVVISGSDYQPWTEVVDTAHNRCAWVVCIDPAVDEQLLQRFEHGGGNAREIIGFGTGVGSHGENNYTISTEKFSLVHIEKKIGHQVADRYGSWGDDLDAKIAKALVQEAARIAGLSVVRATGRSEYVRDFVAYALVRKMLPVDQDVYCDEIISLDTYAHWFNYAQEEMRPDILRLQAKIVDGLFHIEAQIIECKLAQSGEDHLIKARQQIENGLKQLVPRFMPRIDDKPLGIGDLPPDQRYWWMQLHRLVASKGKAAQNQYEKKLLALERLSEGCFNISWRAAAVAFWTDGDVSLVQCKPQWEVQVEEQRLVICVTELGKDFVVQACLHGAQVNPFKGGSAIGYSFVGVDSVPVVYWPDEIETIKDLPEVEVVPLDPVPPLTPVNGAGEVAAGTDEVTEDPSQKENTGDAQGVTDKQATSQQKKEVDNERKSDKEKGVGKEDEKAAVMPLQKHVPSQILLGDTTVGNREVYWEFGHPDLPNRHILVFGASGTGKTYTIQALLSELGRAGQNSVIVDYTNGFTTNQLEPIVVTRLQPKQHVVRQKPLPINPFRKQCEYLDDLVLEENSPTIASRVVGVFAEVYNLGDQQKSALYNAMRSGIEREGNSFNLQSLINELEIIRQNGGPTAGSAASAISKIQPFVDMNPFGEEDVSSWEALFTSRDTKAHIIQLAGFMRDTSRLITEFALFDLYRYYRAQGAEQDPKVIVLDEIQNLDHRKDSPLGQLLTEGRKFGISLILATQTLSNLEKEERDRLFQASHKLFFKPADTEIRSFAQILADATGIRAEEWVHRLSSLRRGECYSLGYAYNEATSQLEVGKYFKVKIKALEDRF